MTLYGLSATSNPDKSITVKRARAPKKEKEGPKPEAAARDLEALQDDLDFKTRLKLRLERREAAECSEQVGEAEGQDYG